MLKTYLIKPLQWFIRAVPGGQRVITAETIFGYMYLYESGDKWEGYEVVDDSQRKQFARNDLDLLQMEATEYYEGLLKEALIEHT